MVVRASVPGTMPSVTQPHWNWSFEVSIAFSKWIQFWFNWKWFGWSLKYIGAFEKLVVPNV